MYIELLGMLVVRVFGSFPTGGHYSNLRMTGRPRLQSWQEWCPSHRLHEIHTNIEK
jgi:hypothetical protein